MVSCAGRLMPGRSSSTSGLLRESTMCTVSLASVTGFNPTFLKELALNSYQNIAAVRPKALIGKQSNLFVP